MSKNTKILILFVFGSLVVVPAISVKIGFVTFHWPLQNSTTLTAMADPPASGPKEPSMPPMVVATTLTPAVDWVTPSATATPTPYVVPFPGYLHCRKAPSFSSEELTLVRGQYLTILAQNQIGDWLYIAVENKRCWVYKDVPYLELTPSQVTRVPITVVVLTLPLPNQQP